MPKIAVECPKCGSPRLLKPGDARRAIERGSVCKKCHCKRIAPQGYRATAEKHGAKFAVLAAREYRLSHPSDLERKVMSTLEGLRFYEVTIEREYIEIGEGERWFILDFALFTPEGQYVIEVNGDYVHQYHAERDAAKLATLQAHGWQVLILDSESVRSPRLSQQIAAFVGLADAS